ncbi:MAG: FHA domain-containing protein [Planctomycetes bacterium]|nr:FHA domain-containing protein [Planctomycetota bacterium]
MEPDDIERTVLMGSARAAAGAGGSSAQLVVLRGLERGRVFRLEGAETGIGRHAGNAVVLSSAAVSKRHAVIDRRAPQAEIRDLGSTNGTKVNNVVLGRGEPRELRFGDTIEVGDHLLLFCRSEEAGLQPELDEIAFDAERVRAEAAALLKEFPELERG